MFPSYLNPLEHPVCLAAPLWNTPQSQWCAHKPFAMFLVDLLRPSTIVDLWAGSGDSYCAFCQAVKAIDAPAGCHAIDAWEGNDGQKALSSLRAHHDPLYGAFSELVRSTPEEAANRFGDGGIDLLHIDGVRPYEGLRRAFDSWLPKMGRGGVVLIHGINLQDGSGARRLWEEAKAGRPCFELMDGTGLGVLAVGEDCPKAFSAMAGLQGSDAQTLMALFSRLGEAASIACARQGEAVGETERCIADLERRIRVKDGYIRNIEQSARINEKMIIEKLSSFEEQLRLKDNHIANLEAIMNSMDWKAMSAAYRFRDALLPKGSRRRSALKGLKGLVRKKP